MPVTMQTAGAKRPPPKIEDPAKATAQQIIDRCGYLDEEIAKAKLLKEERDGLIEFLRGRPEAAKNDPAPFALSGKAYRAKFSKQPTKVVITNMKLLHKKLGDVFYDLATFPITALKDYLTPEERAEVSEEKVVGTRRITIEKADG